MFLSGYHLQEGLLGGFTRNVKRIKKEYKRKKEREEGVRGHDLVQRFYFR